MPLSIKNIGPQNGTEAVRIPESIVLMEFHSVAWMIFKHVFILGHYWEILLEMFL